MAYSDDEVEFVLQSVTNYYFVDADEEPISFSVLPVKFEDDDTEKPPKKQQHVFLHGTGDDGLQKVYRQVTAWKLGLEDDEQPEVTVLTKDKKWIQLLKPRKSYEDCIRTNLITVRVLHFLKRKPQSSGKSLWNHLHEIFRSFEVRPSVKDLLDHYPMIRLFMERDDALAKSQLLLGLLNQKPRKKPFIADSDPKEDMGNDDGDESEEDLDLFDTVCAICDNGGGLICCEGRCMRTFHATRDDGEDSDCKSLGFSRAQVEASQKFLCKNCKYKQHQCFVCWKLGSSDKTAGAEVFPCVNLTCGHFYHPKCIADVLFQKNKTKAADCEKKIAAGESFTCPIHKCHVCKEGENREVMKLQFAVCRRCPTSYHRKCLPRKISFEDIEEEGILQRAWEDLIPGRILIYCLKHKIDQDLGTPLRNHIIFPESPARKKIVDMHKSKGKVLVKKNRQVLNDLPQEQTSIKPPNKTEELLISEESQPVVESGTLAQQVLNFQEQSKPLKDSTKPLKSLGKRNRQVLDDLPQELTSIKPLKVTEKLSSSEKGQPVVGSGRTNTQQVVNFQKKSKPLKEGTQSMKVLAKRNTQVSDDLPQKQTSVKPPKETEKLSTSEASQHVVESGRSITQQVVNLQKQSKSLEDSKETHVHKSDDSVLSNSKRSQKEKANATVPIISSATIAEVVRNSHPEIDVEMEKLKSLVEEASSSLTLESILKKRKVPSTHPHTARNIDQSITLGKIKGSIEAIKAGLRILEDGGTVEEAKAVCQPDVLNQLIRWNKKFKVYLEPFLYGMCYTSFGRHFTTVDKLHEIVNELQWYVQNGDTIVDFCCGANDFSRLMKEKLDAAGKRCSFKNYDLIQPKYDFGFERKDWMKVQPEELPTGSKLIMGLNPPFGVEASLANKYIDKALTFKPKLLILLVPRETQRLDQKRQRYDLIWEDCEKLSGKSFYLPGSVDADNMQIAKWNLRPPLLYLWSRSDWTSNHRAIALKRGHKSKVQQEPLAEEKTRELRVDVHPPEEHISEIHENKKIFTPEETPREGNEKKIVAENKKREPLENHNSWGSKRRRLKRKKHDAADRMNDDDSPQVARDSNRDISKSPLPLETSETPRESFQTSPSARMPGLEFGSISEGGWKTSVVEKDTDDIGNRSSLNLSVDRIRKRDYLSRYLKERISVYSSVGTCCLPGEDDSMRRSRFPVDSFSFAPGPVHPLQRHDSCGWLED